MITRLKDFVKYKLNESTSTGGRTLEDYFKEKGITLAKQRELTTLNCGNKLTSLEGIENCPNLTRLSCNHNHLTSLKGIENCTKLTGLLCGSNQLASLEGLENCPNLTYLNCSGNKLTSLKGIENCPNYLNCSGNKLTSLEGIENLTRLTELHCADNNLPFNNYYKMSVNDIKDSFYLVEHELEISSILCNITDEYDIDRQGFMYEFNDDVTLTEDLLKELKRISKKLNMLGIIIYATINGTIYPITEINELRELREFSSISKIHLKLK